MTRETTLHGHDTRCALCGLAVYSLWVDKEPPPVGCTEGQDDVPWKCGHVLNSLNAAVMRVDYLGAELLPHHQQIIQLIGQERAGAIFAHIREKQSAPKAGKPREPDYSRPSIN